MRLKELREEAGMTQKQLAEKINNVQRNISNWESGNSQPDLDIVVKLAELFGVTTDELLGRTNHFDTLHDYAFHDTIHYGEDTSRIKELTEKLTQKQQQTLIAFLESLINDGK